MRLLTFDVDDLCLDMKSLNIATPNLGDGDVRDEVDDICVKMQSMKLDDPKPAYSMSEGEYAGICSALRALKLDSNESVPITIGLGNLSLNRHLTACVEKLRVAVFDFYFEHKSAIDRFVRQDNQWYFTYHYLTVYVAACGDATTHISFTIQYNLRDMYKNPAIDNMVMEEISDLYADIKHAFADFE